MAEMKEMLKNPIKIELSAPMTIEELFDLMQQNAAAIPGQFELKKGLMGKTIVFGIYMQEKPVISVKGNTVKITRMTDKTEVKVMGVGGDIANMKERAAALKEGGLKAMAMGGHEYFYNVRVSIAELLKSRT